MSSSPARPRAVIRIEPGVLAAAAALAATKPHSPRLAEKLWHLAAEADRQMPAILARFDGDATTDPIRATIHPTS